MSRIVRSVVACVTVILCVSVGRSEDSSRLRRQFAQPPRGYASAPLWVWNDRMTDDKVISTLRDLADQGVKQAFVHPRPGLMTPYLSAEWFRAWKTALKEAERLDMNIWIYDENSYPSGFAGGLVPEAMPEARGRGLILKEVKQPPTSVDDILALYRLTGDRYENVTKRFQESDALPKGQYLVASIRLAPIGGWFGGKFYVDLMKPGVTEKFLEITMGAYEREIGNQFGKRVPGVFTDEPHLAPAGGLHWSEHLPQLFQQRWGYDLMGKLPCLVRRVGDWKRVRYNYYRLLLEQFIEHWSRPYFEYCEKHNLEFTGHYWEHAWPNASHSGDTMALYAWHQRPAIDILMNRYREDVHAQFGNVRSVLELASVANQLGRRRTLCEAYGAGGWDLSFEAMKRIGDWLYVLGVNTLDQHLSYVTICGARKRDHPQSFSYHEPWWEAYHVLAHYFTRLSLVLSSGEQKNHILVLEPTTTAWMYQSDPHMEELGERFQKFVTTLAKRQVEFDIGSEEIMAQHASVDGAKLVVGQRVYDVVVLPEDTENLNSKTFELLQAYLGAGGTVLSCSPPPTRIDGVASERGTALTQSKGYRRIEPLAVADELLSRSRDGFSIRQAADDRGILYHHRRQLDDGQVLFLTNTSIESLCSGSIRCQAGGIERWDAETGVVEPYPFEQVKNGVNARFELPPCGSLLLFLSKKACKPARTQQPQFVPVAPAGSMAIRRIAPNVLTIDYVDVTVAGQTKKNLYFFQAAKFVFQQHGLDGNPWERSVQFRDELIRKTFPSDSGFEATYSFTIRGTVPRPLSVVIERPELYTITCNGQPIRASTDSWWLDKAFGKMDITSAARVGANTVTIQASPMSVYDELEPAYLLGDFTLEPAAAGFVVVPEEPLVLGPAGWNHQGCPFYAAGVAYTQAFDIAQPSGRFVVSLGNWRGSVAKVLVNDKLAGYIVHRPWDCDVSQQIQPGRNQIKVVVIGTLRNTLGPHHAGDVVGAAWPPMFQKGPKTGPPAGASYNTLDYGLFEPFALRRAE